MKRLHIPLPSRVKLSLLAGLLVSIGLSFGLQTPTQALSLDVSGLSNPVPNIVNNVPIVRNVAPLLMPLTQTPIVTVAPMTQPPAIPNQTAPAAPPTTSAPADASTTNQQNIAQASTQRGATPATSVLGATNDTVLLKQQEIAAAPSHVASPSVLYSSRALSSVAATSLFYSGIAGLVIGSWILLVTRPKMRLIPAVI